MTRPAEPAYLSDTERHLAPRSLKRPQPVPSTPLRILLVDDDADLRTITEAVLSAIGYRVHAAANAEEAIIHSRSARPFDLLLTDLQMPGLSGIELAQVLTTIHPTLPVLVVSGSTLSRNSCDLLASRGWHFLPKPFLISHLTHEISTLLSIAESPSL